MKFLRLVGFTIRQVLEEPLTVFVGCFVIVLGSLLIDQSLLNLWRLHRQTNDLVQQSDQLRDKLKNIEQSILKAKDPTFIERLARDRFDLVSEGDLIFIFSENEQLISEEEVDGRKDQVL